ncbi:DedA family protein [Microvirgula curvata]|uniref:DedA family protein n=1 Tax=Microvirgula aerodenitrificans TaxID=57480 RepID=UPI00248E43F2|nr:DedA family protein [Microvirgula aerodenitrificans]
MMLAGLIAQYGYLAVFAGTLLEGETVLILAGFAAHQGYLSWPLVVVTAICGGTLGDQACFFAGRHYGGSLFRRFPGWRPRVEQVNRLLLRYHGGVIVAVRFLYGLRLVGPVAIGMSEVPAWRFVLFNLIGAAIWAPLVAGVGFLFGRSLQWLFADIQRYEVAALVLLVALSLLTAWWRSRRHRR